MGENYFEVQHFDTWKLLKFLWPIGRGNTYIFTISYQTKNQKNKLFVDMEKSMYFSLSKKTEI